MFKKTKTPISDDKIILIDNKKLTKEQRRITKQIEKNSELGKPLHDSTGHGLI